MMKHDGTCTISTPRLRRVDREAFARDLALQLTAVPEAGPALAVEEVELRLAALAGGQGEGAGLIFTGNLVKLGDLHIFKPKWWWNGTHNPL